MMHTHTLYKTTLNILGVFMVSFSLLSCGSDLSIDAKKKKLEEFQKKRADLDFKIAELEKELAGQLAEKEVFATTVTVEPLRKTDFKSHFEFQAVVQSDKNVVVSSENPGLVNGVFVKEGQKVVKGQLLCSIDATILKSQLQEMETALELARELFQKQERLYRQNIGTELQFLESKNRLESLERQKESMLQRMSKFNVKSPFNGVVDELFTRNGSMVNPGSPLLRLVDNSELKIVAQVPESYLGVIAPGDVVEVRYPGLHKTVTEKVSSVSQVINPDNRTFQVFIETQSQGLTLKPNLLAIVKATDFKADSVLVIPTQLLKRNVDNQTYVYVVEKNEQNKNIVHKRFIVIDRYGSDYSVVGEGIQPNDLLIVKGYNSVDENDIVQLVTDQP
jgi:RND family efflux transporter MFP subunit